MPRLGRSLRSREVQAPARRSAARAWPVALPIFLAGLVAGAVTMALFARAVPHAAAPAPHLGLAAAALAPPADGALPALPRAGDPFSVIPVAALVAPGFKSPPAFAALSLPEVVPSPPVAVTVSKFRTEAARDLASAWILGDLTSGSASIISATAVLHPPTDRNGPAVRPARPVPSYDTPDEPPPSTAGPSRPGKADRAERPRPPKQPDARPAPSLKPAKTRELPGRGAEPRGNGWGRARDQSSRHAQAPGRSGPGYSGKGGPRGSSAKGGSHGNSGKGGSHGNSGKGGSHGNSGKGGSNGNSGKGGSNGNSGNGGGKGGKH